jgi:D-alanine--poly(phosphoribitol) ligase subunit 2
VQKEDLTQLISDLAVKALGREAVKPEEDFFDLGASSLTIVELQIQLENALGVTAPTSDLMGSPSVQGWAGIYEAAAAAAASNAGAADALPQMHAAQ